MRGGIVEPWRARLAEGDAEVAWDLFIGRYRRIIVTTIRRIVEEDNVLDAFGHICQALAADDLSRLRRYREHAPRQARFSTWLVTVVHNLVIDWLRQYEGRRRVSVPATLSDVQRQIFICVFVEQRSHAETYEIVCAERGATSFALFLKELAGTYRIVERVRPRGVMHYLQGLHVPGPIEANGDTHLAATEMARRLSTALESIATDERVALQLFVVDGMPAADVARTLAWPNAKAVYNRVYRALRNLRAVLERDGIGRADL
jgi:RNA polymerase sigma factor (sigma-70 family)